jgi:hypothetical protein
MNRRKFIASLSTVGVCGLAGCSQLLSDDTGDESTTPQPTIRDGPAKFTNFKIAVKEENPTVGTVKLTVSAFNYGSLSGNYSGTLMAIKGGGTVSKGFTLSAVKSGTRGKTTVDLSFKISDDYVLAVTDRAATETIMGRSSITDPRTKTKLAIDPKTKAVSESFTLPPSVRVTLTDVKYRQGVYYQNPDSKKVPYFYSTTSDKILAVLRFNVENQGNQSASFGSEKLSVSGGRMVTVFGEGFSSQSLSSVNGIKGNTLVGVSVKPAQRAHGWLLAEVPRKQAKKGAAVNWQQDAHETPPERVWNVKPAKLPSFKLDKWTLDTKQIPGTYPLDLTVKNTGAAKGVFRGMLDSKPAKKAQDEWSVFKKLTATIPPGKTKTFKSSVRWPYLSDLDLRMRPFDTTKSVNIQRPDLPFGKKAVFPAGTIEIRDFQTAPSIQEEDGEKYGPELYGGDKFALARVEIVSNTSGQISVPSEMAFKLHANSATYSEASLTYYSIHITEPINGNTYIGDNAIDVQAGKPVGGWITFGVPANVNASNATIVLNTEGDSGLPYGAKWGNGTSK